MIKLLPTKIPDVKIIQPQIFRDERGFFFESFNQKNFNELLGEDVSFVQDNHSKSSYGVLRGLHYQKYPYEQGKLIRVISGMIWDVAVDIRPGSSSYGQWVGEFLSSDDHKQLWIPKGFAHGFIVLSEYAEICYKTDQFYKPEFEISIKFNDKNLSIMWPKINGNPILSHKDSLGFDFKSLKSTFE